MISYGHHDISRRNYQGSAHQPAGRALLTNDGELAFQSGASASITGNMLTTAACATIRSDKKMLQGLGRDVTPEYMKKEPFIHIRAER